MTGPKELIDKLHKNQELSLEEWTELIKNRTPELSEYLFELAREERHKYYGHDVYVRGLIEFTNYCRNDCLYCGIRKSNAAAHRYRLDEDTILRCCQEGYLRYSDGTDYRRQFIVGIHRKSLPYGTGADRYLLRHETYNPEHYAKLHPPILSAAHRQQCLWDLKDIGYQVGTGFMVGAPFQTPEYLAEDMQFLKELNPHMVGIGPFIPHHDTPFANQPAGTLELTLFMLGLIRLMLPKVLLPATTALGTIHPKGRELGILAGANVVMPNLSPTEVRKDYLLYDNKICTGDESAQCRHCLERRMASVGYQVVTSRGDSLNI